jgi:hypothetical protein
MITTFLTIQNTEFACYIIICPDSLRGRGRDSHLFLLADIFYMIPGKNVTKLFVKKLLIADKERIRSW